MAEQTLELRLLKKKHDRGWGRRRMRYPAPEKLEIIRLVEQSHLPVKKTLEQLAFAEIHGTPREFSPFIAPNYQELFEPDRLLEILNQED
ncbi:UNVERIFIED_ORG: hypothetical protein BCL66_110116 [Martelella mediterranea]